MLASGRQTISFELIATSALVTLQFACNSGGAYWLRAQLEAYLPECAVSEVRDDMLAALMKGGGGFCASDFGLSEEFTRPMAGFEGKGQDPYTPLFGVISQLREREAVVVQALFCGLRHAWAESINNSVTDNRGDGSFFYNAPEMPRLAQEKTALPLVGASLRVLTIAETGQAAQHLAEHGVRCIVLASISPANSLLALPNHDYSLELRLRDIAGRQTRRLGMILNVRELAAFAHLPSASLSRLLANGRATKGAPEHLSDESYVLGINEHQGRSAAVGIGVMQRTKHVHILGGSGVGKSTLLHSLMLQDIRNGMGLCCLDPHGDLIDLVLDSIPAGRVQDVVLIDPSDAGYPVGFNILSAHSDAERELLASDLVSLFRRFNTSWGDNLNSILANAVMAFLYNSTPGHLGELRRFLVEPAYRSLKLATCTDADIKYYWQTEYPLIKSASIGSILTRLDSFLRPRAIRNMICQHRGLDFGSLMDSSKIVLVKLSQGLMGAENSYLLGACIVAKLQQCAMARQQQSARDRVPFFCYIDEFHNFVTESMGHILSGGRKFGLGLVLAHQDMQQVQRNDSDIASALMSNAGTRICFRLSDTDARRMQEGFGGFNADDLQNLGVGEAVARVNTADADFNLSIVQASEDAGQKAACIEHSRDRYSVQVSPAADSASDQEPTSQSPPAIARHDLPSESAPDKYASSAETERPNRSEMREHRYLQNLIKAMAEQHGYKANLEVPTEDGLGQIDVLLQKGTETIAVEVSVSTGAEWELHNIRKCLAAGHARIVVCSPKPQKLLQIEKKVNQSLSAEQREKVLLIAPERISLLFADSADRYSEDKTMKGYRIKVKYDSATQDSIKAEIIKRIVRKQAPGV